MKGKAVLYAALLLIVSVSCTHEEPSPLELAITDKIKERNTQLEELEISNLSVVDSISLGEELDRRIALFRTKVKAENMMADKCENQKAPAKAREHRQKAAQAETILEVLSQWKGSPSRDMDSTLYYIASFCVSGKLYDGAILNPTQMQASFDAEGKVYNVQDSKGNVHTGMGATIPGYKKYLKDISIDEPSTNQE